MNEHGDHNDRRSVRAWLRRWPEWTGIAAGGWALLASVVTILWASGRRAGYPLGDLAAAGPVAALSAVVFVTAAVAAWATRPRRRRRPPRRTVLVVLWAAAALAVVGGFGFVMYAVQLVFSGTVDDWARFAVTIGSAIGAALLIAAALSFRHRSRELCPRCGRSHELTDAVTAYPPPEPAPQKIQWVAYAGAVAFLPYMTMKTIWALGGTFGGVTGAEMIANAEKWNASKLMLTLMRYGLDPTALAAVVGIVLLLSLVRPWGRILPRWVPGVAGRRVPRWLPLIPAWLGAATLAPYGVVCLTWIGLGALGLVSINWGTDAEMFSGAGRWMVSGFGFGAFAPFGIALGIAALSYQRRTKPVCVSRSAGGERWPTLERELPRWAGQA